MKEGLEIALPLEFLHISTHRQLSVSEPFANLTLIDSCTKDYT